MPNSLLSLRDGTCLTIVTLYSILFVIIGLSKQESGHPGQAHRDEIVKYISDIRNYDSVSATSSLLGTIMCFAFLCTCAYLFVKAFRMQARGADDLPIPVSRLAGVDTIEDIFKLGKRRYSDPDVDSSTDDQSEEVPLSSTRLYQVESLSSTAFAACTQTITDSSTPLLVSSPNIPTSSVSYDPLDTPELSPFYSGCDTPVSKEKRRVFGIIVHRSPTKYGTEDPDDVHYLRAALGLTHLQSPPRFCEHDEHASHEKKTMELYHSDEGEISTWVFPRRQDATVIESLLDYDQRRRV